MVIHLLTDFGVLTETALVDLSLAADNAMLLAMAVQNIPKEQRRTALIAGASLGALLRCGLAIITAQLIKLPAISIMGGLFLIWVCYTIYRHIMNPKQEEGVPSARTQMDAIMKIIVADLSMSIDNVIGVAGATENHHLIMIFGILFSVVLIVLLTEQIGKLLDRFKWINWMGMVLILFIAAQMLYRGIIPYIYAAS